MSTLTAAQIHPPLNYPLAHSDTCHTGLCKQKGTLHSILPLMVRAAEGSDDGEGKLGELAPWLESMSDGTGVTAGESTIISKQSISYMHALQGTCLYTIS